MAPPFTTAGRALQPQEPRITLSLQLSASLQYLKQRITLLPDPYACCVLFFTVAAEEVPAGVFFVRRATLEAAWREGTTRVRQWAWMRQLSAVELRIDWPDELVVIGDRIPVLRQWGAASAWALADADLEHAELIPPLALAANGPGTEDAQFRQVAGAPVFPVLAEVNLLLRLRGLYVGGDGVPTDLPRADGPQCMPLVPAASTCAIPSCDGGVAYGAGCDRRCVTSALLLAQQHVHDTDLSQVGLIQAMDRAFACLEKNLHGMRLRQCADYVEQAMGLLIITRYISRRNTHGAFTRLVCHMERLARVLDGLRSGPSQDDSV